MFCTFVPEGIMVTRLTDAHWGMCKVYEEYVIARNL